MLQGTTWVKEIVLSHTSELECSRTLKRWLEVSEDLMKSLGTKRWKCIPLLKTKGQEQREHIPEPEEREEPLGGPESPTNLSSGASPLWVRPHHRG